MRRKQMLWAVGFACLVVFWAGGQRVVAEKAVEAILWG
jgi:hypothetical protein